jgi:Ca2+-binding EF-hand superfamily protein
VDEIIPEVEKNDPGDPVGKDYIQLEAFEKHLIIVINKNLYPSYDKEILIEAFRLLDTDRNGYLDLHTFYTFVKSFGVAFSKKQIAEMELFLKENETDFLEPMKINKEEVSREKFTQFTTRKFYYEAYVRKIVVDNKKHFDMLMSEFKTYMEDYKRKKQIEKETKQA